ncbi:MAG: HAMP domain-containing histidine kinase [Anaerolineae bacterium]|nr:MAG: HAMP domain-containing histidine kinase [Anaerolineae bacterium]
MSLRARLTLFTASFLALVLLGFGTVVYVRVNAVLIGRADALLTSAAEAAARALALTPDGAYTLANRTPLNETTIVQIWTRSGSLIRVLDGIQVVPVPLVPFAPGSLSTDVPVVDELLFDGNHLRVLTLPVYDEEGRIATMQVATDLSEVDAVLRNLLQSLVLTGMAALAVAAGGAWLITRSLLEPLLALTQTAMGITRADDLSLRIPSKHAEGDEVGRLVQAFNTTLERLEELFNSQRRFVADVSHELRTPLTVMKGNADFMRRLDRMDRESLDGIEKEIDRMTRMVGDLLLLAQAEGGHLPLDRRKVELDTLLLEVYQQACLLAGESKHIQIEEIDQVLVCGDHDRLKQVMLNLLGNAIKYTQEGAHIRLRLNKHQGQAWLAVIDDGPGIPEADLAHIFERFYRAEKARSRSEDGAGFGLGLSIAYWIVQNHGGRIAVRSDEGVGATFIVTLPLAEADCPEPVMASGQAVPQPVRTN